MNDYKERAEDFRRNVIEIGGTIYSKRCLSEFSDYWCENDRGKRIKLRWEKEKTFAIEYRLRTWASRVKGYEAFLSYSEKTIEQKKRDFIAQLRPYLDKYGKDMVNSFYRHWAQPENSATPTRLRWELQDFWSLDTRLEVWHQREIEKNKHKAF